MSDDTPTDDQGNTEPVVPTDAPVDEKADAPKKAPTKADLETKVAELEAEVERLDAYVQELEDDPYRAPAGGSGDGVVTDQLVAFEAQLDEAEIQAWERTTGLTYDDAPVDKVEV